MGVVYLAFDQNLRREVAIKRLLTGEDATKHGFDPLLREARAIAALNHRNIVTIHEVGEDQRGPFIVMEYLAGGDLRKAIHDAGKIDTAGSLAIIKALGQGLTYAHAKGIIHRDIKPGNVLLDEHGMAKLVDFGLAHMGQDTGLTATGQGMGTMEYMAPEQRGDARHVDARSDIYALAKMLYHMITGEVPTTVDLEMVPAELRPALRQALKYKPQERPASVADFLELLAEPIPVVTPSSAVDAASFRPGRCTSCNHVNPEDARFCEGCGAGLFEACPKCNAENRLGVKHCAECGIKVAEFKSASEALQHARKLLKDHKPENAIAVVQSALAVRLIRDETQVDELEEVLKEAETVKSQIISLEAKAKRFIQDGVLDEAIQTLNQTIAIDPYRRDLLDLRKSCENQHRRADLVSARYSLQEGHFGSAIRSCQSVLKLEPSNTEAAAMLSQAQALHLAETTRLEALDLAEARRLDALDQAETMRQQARDQAKMMRVRASMPVWDDYTQTGQNPAVAEGDPLAQLQMAVNAAPPRPPSSAAQRHLGNQNKRKAGFLKCIGLASALVCVATLIIAASNRNPDDEVWALFATAASVAAFVGPPLGFVFWALSGKWSSRSQ